MILVTWFIDAVRAPDAAALAGLRACRGMRWKFFAACLGLAVVALLAQVLVGALLPAGDPATSSPARPTTSPTATALAALVILLTTPLQAAGEEYVFRGYLMQAFGSLFAATVGGDRSSRRTAVRARARRPELAAVLRPVRVRADRRLAGDPHRRAGGRDRAAHPEQLTWPSGSRSPFGDISDDAQRLARSAGGTSRVTAHPVQRLPRAGAARGPQDGSADHTGPPRQLPEPASGAARGRRPRRRSRRLVAAREGRVFSSGLRKKPRSHGVWGNWQPDWFWSS